MNDETKKEYDAFNSQYHKDYYQKNKVRLQAAQKKYRIENWDRVKAVQYEWQKNNPEKYAEVRARAKANKILRDIKYRESHPEIWHKLPTGRWQKNQRRKSKYRDETPAQKAERLKAQSKAKWQKDKLDPVKVLAHRNRALVYAHKIYHQKNKQRLRMKVIDVINQIRLKKLKADLYENLQTTRGGSGYTERIPPAQNKGKVGTATPRWRETLRGLLKKRLG